MHDETFSICLDAQYGSNQAKNLTRPNKNNQNTAKSKSQNRLILSNAPSIPKNTIIDNRGGYTNQQ